MGARGGLACYDRGAAFVLHQHGWQHSGHGAARDSRAIGRVPFLKSIGRDMRSRFYTQDQDWWQVLREAIRTLWVR